MSRARVPRSSYAIMRDGSFVSRRDVLSVAFDAAIYVSSRDPGGEIIVINETTGEILWLYQPACAALPGDLCPRSRRENLARLSIRSS